MGVGGGAVEEEGNVGEWEINHCSGNCFCEVLQGLPCWQEQEPCEGGRDGTNGQGK